MNKLEKLFSMENVFEATNFYISEKHKNKHNTPTVYNADECIEWMAKFHNKMKEKEPKRIVKFLGITIIKTF